MATYREAVARPRPRGVFPPFVTRRGGRAIARRIVLWTVATGAASCGGTTGREDAPPIVATEVADAASDEDATVPNLDADTFDVTITYVDRVLPDVMIRAPAADAGDAEAGSDWPCPPDLFVASDTDSGCADAATDGGCPSVPIAAEYDDAGAVIPAPAGSLCATCAPYNGGAGCTPTEQAFIEHDPSGACDTCLVEGGSLDDLVFPDVGHECADIMSNVDVSSEQAAAFCLSTLHCILGPTPNAPTCAIGGQPTFCYCGAGVDPTACEKLTTTPTGACAQEETAGLGTATMPLPLLPTSTVLKAYPNQNLGSGIANAIFSSAAANGCTTCF